MAKIDNKYIFNEFWRIIRIAVFSLCAEVFCWLVYLVTFEKGSGKTATKRKIKRIRFFTKLKLWAWNNFPKFCKYFFIDEYLNYLEKKIKKDGV